MEREETLPLKREVRKGLGSHPESLGAHKARVGVVLDVLPLNEVLQVEQGASLPLVQLQHRHLKDVHLE